MELKLELIMSQAPPRGGSSGSSRGARHRGGRSRGKSQRARGSTRGLRIPPEYLAQVIAQREGRDPNDIQELGEDDLDEEEINEYYSRFAARPLESNEAKYEEPTTEETGDANNEDNDTQEVLAMHRIKVASGTGVSGSEQAYMKPKKQQNYDEADGADVDHALGASLRALSMKAGGKGMREDDVREPSKVIKIEWNKELEEMSREKSEAEARNALKERLKASEVLRGKPSRSIKPTTVPHSQGHTSKPDMEQLEDFLDDLLQ
ncbi:hypothetical protein FS842_003209 [Serendipita sp. 407]|nr:hypothetical protein FS842_003209 [Serendipita sp. 407]